MKSGTRAVALASGVAVLVLAAASFFFVTVFINDDYLFLTFARLVRNPLVAFVSDQHGGEFYRPIPMTLWWLLTHAGGGAPWPFMLATAALHTLVAAEIALLVRLVGEEKIVAVTAGIFFFLAPQTLDAAYWFSASTDLLATAVALGSLIVLRRARRRASLIGLSALLAAVAYLCKESALILPLLAWLVMRGAKGEATSGKFVVPHALLAAGYVVVRWFILRGWGGSGDARASLSGKALQLLSGLVHIATGQAALPEPLAWGLGAVVLLVLLRHAFVAHRRREPKPAVTLALALVGIALLPLVGADWAVGSRYFYFPTVGVAWLMARQLVATPVVGRALIFGLLIFCDFRQARQRHVEIGAFTERLAACRRAVIAGLDRGHTVFQIGSGIKDLDLALKADPVLANDPRAASLLVLTDVPASFVLRPPALAAPAAFMVASPPLPPSGAYRFGAGRVVGLARRGDDPLLSQVVDHFPDTQFITLRLSGAGKVITRNITQEITGNVNLR
ncbi:MAG TPA: hypothetical protein VGL59_22910 [Polyangia bacterium]